MRAVAVLPFVADEVDPDAYDLARFLTAETAAELAVPGVIETQLVTDRVELSRAALSLAAAQLGAAAALGAAAQVERGQLHLRVLLAGAVDAAWDESAPLGAALQLPRTIARAVLECLGEATPPLDVEPSQDSERVLRFCRAALRMDLDELVELSEVSAARRKLLDAAHAAVGGDQMPDFLSALERLAEARPDDAAVLLALAEYRALHFDDAGARELCLAAREVADEPALEARACAGLAALAEAAGRVDEAILHLRAAIKLEDDARLYARLGALLLDRDAGEGVQMLTRATVLAPDDGRLQLMLARAIREHGGDIAKAVAAATRAAEDPELAEEVRAELEQLLAES